MNRIDISGQSAQAKGFIGDIGCDSLQQAEPQVHVTSVRPDLLHVKLTFAIERDTAQDDWQLRITPSFLPSFHWAPHLTPTDEHIIDQHSFRAPALIVTDPNKGLAMIPDLDLLAEAAPVRWYMDLDAKRNRLTLGMSASKVKEHVLYVLEPGAVYPAGEVGIGFYVLFYTEEQQIRNPWRPALDFMWSRWGSRAYAQGQPLTTPLEHYVKHTYRWAFESWKTWQQFDLDGKKAGAPVFIVNVTQSPNYPGEIREREILSIWNQAWFSSLRSAQGLYRYGKRIRRDDYVQRALMTKELALSAPQTNGLFPSVIAVEKEMVEPTDGKPYRRSLGWDTYYWGNSDRNPISRNFKTAPYHILDMSWTCLLMLRWYEELERDERLLEYAVRYADSLLALQDGDGFFPAWLDRETTKPLNILADSPETSLSVTFLLKLYRFVDRERYLQAALKAMSAVSREIIPDGRWEDFETYWSCCRYGNETLVGHKVERNNMYKQCNFSMFWTAEALLSCYRSTGDRTYLTLGQRCLDELLMTQAVWQPSYLYVPVFGGFGVMNCDGEWNDARQSLFAELIIEYGRELGIDEYIRRGKAALRASFIMMYCPENPAVKALWEKKWPFFGEEDYGFTMENYGHDGRVNPDGAGMGEFTIYDWGNGAASESYLRITDRYGPDFLDDYTTKG